MAALVGIPSDCEGPFSFLLLFVTILLCDFGSQTQFRRNSDAILSIVMGRYRFGCITMVLSSLF